MKGISFFLKAEEEEERQEIKSLEVREASSLHFKMFPYHTLPCVKVADL